MKKKDIDKIVKGDFVMHKHLGLCIVDTVQLCSIGTFFGLVLRPVLIEGYINLAYNSDVLFNRYLETSNRLILSKEDNPTIPKLIFKKEDKFEVSEWLTDHIGEVSTEGVFSVKPLLVFDDLASAIAYSNE